MSNSAKKRQKKELAIFCSGMLLLLALALASNAYYYDSSGTSAIRRGDFPAFYAGGVIVNEGNADKLYSLEHHAEVQNRYWPNLEGKKYLYFYPPYVAALFSPMAKLPPHLAKCLLVSLMFAAYAASTFFISRTAPQFEGKKLFLLTLILYSGPGLYGIIGGQNVALSLLCVSAAVYYLSLKTARSEFIAGLALGVWLIKPHFALAALLLCLIAGKWRCLLGASLPALFFYLLGSAVLGLNWPISWALRAVELSFLDHSFAGHLMVSIYGMVSAMIGLFSDAAHARSAATIISFALSLHVLFLAAKTIRKCGATEKANAFLLIGPAAVLISPHTAFYDLTFALTALLPFVDLKNKRHMLMLLLTVAASLLLSIYRDLFFLTPLALLSVFSFWYVNKKIQAAATSK